MENQNKPTDSDKQLKMDEFDVQTIYGELFNLPIYGKEIKKMFDTGMDSQKEMVGETFIHLFSIVIILIFHKQWFQIQQTYM